MAFDSGEVDLSLGIVASQLWTGSNTLFVPCSSLRPTNSFADAKNQFKLKAGSAKSA